MTKINKIGSEKHQLLLNNLTNLFSSESNIKMFGVYCSLVTGKWDKYSDYDIFVIVESDNEKKIQSYIEKIKQLLTKNGIDVVIVNYEGNGKWALVLDNLDRINITFHQTKNASPKKPNTLNYLNNRFFDLAINVQIAIRRQDLNKAIDELNQLKDILSQMNMLVNKTCSKSSLVDVKKCLDYLLDEYIKKNSHLDQKYKLLAQKIKKF